MLIIYDFPMLVSTNKSHEMGLLNIFDKADCSITIGVL